VCGDGPDVGGAVDDLAGEIGQAAVVGAGVAARLDE
jgi:hypothetical protein